MAVAELLTWPVAISLPVGVLTLLYLYGKWPYSVWKNLGIPGPKPSLFFGNLAEIRKKGVGAAVTDWGKEFGTTFGFYFFRTPFIATKDLDIIKEAFIKDFSNFNARGIPDGTMPAAMKITVLQSHGKQWKRQRQLLTNMFSASKLKQMNIFIGRCCSNLVKYIEKQTLEGEPLDVKKTFGCFTLDVIAGTGFGLDTNCLEDDDAAMIKTIRDFFALPPVDMPSIVSNIFPILSPIMRVIKQTTSDRQRKLNVVLRTIEAVMEERKHEPDSGQADLLRQLMNVEVPAAELKDPDVKGLSRAEILSQGLILFLAGYETTASLLQFLSYALARNPEKQEKLHDEIVAALGDSEPSYESVSSISYLDSCLHEAMRCFPPIQIYGRQAHESRTIKGVHIPAGASLICPVTTVTQDPGYFPDPEKFLPERFEKDASPPVPHMVRDIVFGVGPRQCLGMRLALFEAKMAAVTILRKFRFVKIDQTPESFSMKGTSPISTPTETILVGTQLRN